MSFDLHVVNGDLILKNGDLETVSNQDKLIQDIVKICITPVGASVYNPWYGSYISKALVGSVLDNSITTVIAKNQLQNSIDNLKKLQAEQARDTTQQVTPDEQIAAIKDISVDRDPTDPRNFMVNVRVLTRTLRQLNANFGIT